MTSESQQRAHRPDDKLVIVGCDTQVIMWAFPWTMREDQKGKKTQDVREMRRRARLLMKLLPAEDSQIVIPSVVIAELLAGVNPQKHARIMAEFDERFFCPPFDIKACSLAAKLWQFEHGLRDIQQGLPQQERTARAILKADILIVATANDGWSLYLLQP